MKIKSIKVALTAILIAQNASLSAQWLGYPSAGIPRKADGSPDLSAPAPKKNLSGIWHRIRPSGAPTGPEFGNSVNYYMPEGSTLPLRPWAAELLNQRRFSNLGAGRPSERCLPHGILGGMLPNVPFKVIETPGNTILLFEQLTQFRQIFTDGRPFPQEMQPAWYGYSIGKWEDDVFVVESRGFNDLTWLDDSGTPNTEAMHATERFRRIDFGHMDLEITIDDPKAYTAPWRVLIHLELMPDTELIEDVCDNERDARHMLAK